MEMEMVVTVLSFYKYCYIVPDSMTIIRRAWILLPSWHECSMYTHLIPTAVQAYISLSGHR